MPLIATRGAASAQGFGEFSQSALAVYIEDVFQTWLYSGNSSTQTITNGVNLSGNGGLTWIKSRSAASGHRLVDTVRGATKALASSSTSAEFTEANGLTAFNASGFVLGDSSDYNAVNETFTSWTFREQLKFFDVVTFTTNSSATTNQRISHNLGSTPGTIIVKNTGTASGWPVWHRSLASATNSYLLLNTTDAVGTYTNCWGTSGPTSTDFGINTAFFGTSANYVAYIFAHNAGGFGLTGSDNVITCGSYTGNGNVSGPTITLGYEPQWLMIKNTTDAATDWLMYDVMRGIPVVSTNSSSTRFLRANTAGAEAGGASVIPTATGFQLITTFQGANFLGSNYIYIAIRRGPMKTPTSSTSVFTPVLWTGNNAARTITGIGFPLDTAITHIRNNGGTSTQSLTFDRLRGATSTSAQLLSVTSTNAETAYTSVGNFDYMDGFRILDGDSRINDAGIPSTYVGYFFRRAPNFYDVVCYTGTGSATTFSHNLGIAPDLMIIKIRNQPGAAWAVYNSASGNTKVLRANTTAGETTSSAYWNNTSPTSSVFTVGNDGDVNNAGDTYVARLFATLAGVSKVGSYTGTGSTQTIDCGFTAGSRFVLIKRTDGVGDWYIWDSARGIVAGNDPYLLLNSVAAEVTTTDWIDTANSGFELSNSAGNLANSNGVSYIFLAIA